MYYNNKHFHLKNVLLSQIRMVISIVLLNII